MIVDTKPQIVIRMATTNDLPVLFTFFDVYSRINLDLYGVKIDLPRCKESIENFVKNNSVLMGEVEGIAIGAVAGAVQHCLFSKDIIYAIMFFYVRASFRRFTSSFMKEIELFLLPSHVTRISFGVPGFSDYEKMCRFMKIQGYKVLESHFYKAV